MAIERAAPSSYKTPAAAAGIPASGELRLRDEPNIRHALKTSRNGLIFVGLFSIVVNMLMLTTSIYLLQISDRVLVSRSTDTLIMLTVIAVAAITALALFDLLRKWILTRLGVRLEASLGGPLLAASIERSAGGVSPEVQGLRDLASVRAFLGGPVVPTLFDLPLAPAYIAIVYLIHPHLGHITLAGALLLAAFALLNQMVTKRSLADASKSGMVALAQAQAHTRNSDTVRAMGMLNDSIRLWGQENVKSLNAQVRAANRNAIVSAASKFFRLALQIAILGWGAYLTLDGQVTAGMSIAASIIGARGLAPVESAIESWKQFQQARESFSRVSRLLMSSEAAQPRTELPPPTGHLVVEKLVYLSPTRDPIIKQITFGIQPGTTIALIGPTGAGKSTLGKLLVGALPASSGTIRIDGTDLKNWDPMQLGRSIGYLPQDVELFPGTIAENIARMRADVSDAEIVRAAQFAGAHDLISKLKNGYQTVVYERGAPLSGGQRQRVALARAFFGNPKFVVLDEPDAALDSEGEAALLGTIGNAKKAGVTVLATTQRSALLRFVDKILVLKDGNIEIYGPREQVLPRLMPHLASAANVEDKDSGQARKHGGQV